MGAKCCVAAREKPLPDRISRELSSDRNVRHSASWSFRWDNRTHIEDIMDNPSRFSHQNNGNIGSESKSATDTETEGLSDGGSTAGSLQTPKRQKKVGISRSSESVAADVRDPSTKSKLSAEEKAAFESSAVASASETKSSVSILSTPSSSSCKSLDLSSSRSCSLQLDPSSSRKARRSPGYQLSRPVSYSRIPSLKSLNESSNFSPEGRQSFVHSVCSNDLSAGGSHGISDGWSLQTFTELVAASSHRERWSLDSENLGSVNRSRMVGTSPPSADLQTCRVCSKLLKEKSPWSGQKIVSTNELSVAAVLICGHVYHVECLESITSEVDRYDPPCPVCTNSVMLTPKLLAKAELKARSMISRRAVADIDIYGDSAPDRLKLGGKWPSMGASSSTEGSLGRPFVRRHLSIGLRPPPARPASESEITRKKNGFWARYRRD